MILNNKQEEGLKIAVTRYKNKEPYACIAGYAGSGKSTLIKFIIAALGISNQDVCYVAYTGKAATVLKQKGCPNAYTAHKLLYNTRPKGDGTFMFIPKKKGEINYKVIVVDEISMLPKEMWELLLTHKIYILALGDPGQLPPVNPEEDNHVLDNPHIFLDEVMRQAQDSEIIRLSMHIRDGKPISTFPCQKQQVQICDKYNIVSGMYFWADQILCATNNKRNEINNFVRESLGYGPEPQVGDKIISLSNHWDDISQSGEWTLTNGLISNVKQFHKNTIKIPPYISENPITYMWTDANVENDMFCSIPIDYNCLITGEPTLNKKQSFQLSKMKRYKAPYEFAYAYGITTHKAQGSEWDKVLVFEENFPFDKETHKKWLYTAATRAKEKLVIIKK